MVCRGLIFENIKIRFSYVISKQYLLNYLHVNQKSTVDKVSQVLYFYLNNYLFKLLNFIYFSRRFFA